MYVLSSIRVRVSFSEEIQPNCAESKNPYTHNVIITRARLMVYLHFFARLLIARCTLQEHSVQSRTSDRKTRKHGAASQLEIRSLEASASKRRIAHESNELVRKRRRSKSWINISDINDLSACYVAVTDVNVSLRQAPAFYQPSLQPSVWTSIIILFDETIARLHIPILLLTFSLVVFAGESCKFAGLEKDGRSARMQHRRRRRHSLAVRE